MLKTSFFAKRAFSCKSEASEGKVKVKKAIFRGVFVVESRGQTNICEASEGIFAKPFNARA